MSSSFEIDDSSSSFSFLEDSGIFLGTKKQSSAKATTVEPPKIQQKRIISRGGRGRSSSLPTSSAPTCIVGQEHFNGIFPSRQYSRRLDATYLHQCFEVLEKIGEGSFGTVHKVRSKDDGVMYAAKVFKETYKGSIHRKRLLEEILQHKQVSGHTNIVTLYQAWEEDGLLYIILELCEASLDIYAQEHHNVSEPMVRKILFDMLHAVKYIHGKNLIHLDIKLANILLGKDGNYKLGDFGLVLDLTREVDTRDLLEGDSKYLAPEVLRGNFSKAADIFSLGISMIEIACDLVLPSCGEEWQQLRQNKIPKSQTAKLSKEILDIITAMMNQSFRLRPTADDILKSLEPVQQKIGSDQPITYLSRLRSLGENLFISGHHQVSKLLAIWTWLREILFRNLYEMITPNSPIRQVAVDQTTFQLTPTFSGRQTHARKRISYYSSDSD